MMFNHLAAVKIGGKYNRNDEIESHFDGIIAGYSYLGLCIL
jgi:hypothetical protein